MLGKLVGGHLHNGYTPHPAALRIHNDPSRFRIAVCGRRFGKTTLALNELYMHAWLNTDPLARCWYVAPNYRQAKDTAWLMLKEIIPEQVISSVNEAELTIQLVNRSLISLKGADAQDSLRGSKLKFGVLDEYATMRSTVWEEIIRPAMSDVPGSKAMFIGTPKGYTHFKKLFDKGVKKEDNFRSFTFKTLDNPYIDPEEIAEIKRATNPLIFAQEYEGKFIQLAGSIYPMFKRDNHVVRGHEFPEHWERVVAMDWGMKNPTAIVFAAIGHDGDVWVYDLLYGGGKTVSQWASILKDRNDFSQINNWIIDPSALAQAKEFGQYGIHFISYNPDTNQRLNNVNIGINLVSEYLLKNKIKIFDHCDVLIEQMEQYQWEPSQGRYGQETKSKPLKMNDHSCDALRYLVMGKLITSELKENKYKGLDPASEMFWRSHNNDMPKEVQMLQPRDALLYGVDDYGYDVLGEF